MTKALALVGLIAAGLAVSAPEEKAHVKGGEIPGQRGGARAGHWREGGRHEKGPDRAPFHVGGENSEGLRRHDFARAWIDLGGGAGLVLLRPEV
jgi:hypothetical protein